MEQGQVIEIMQDAITTTLYAALPVLGVALVIGIVISIFQAATQINDQTLTFVPKLIGILLAILVFGVFMLTILTEFGQRVFEYVANFTL